jgi:malic enzyme
MYSSSLFVVESDDLKLLEEAIRENPDYADVVTFKHNLAAIMTNGTAILGFGDIGPAAGLPVMEGKSVLFKSLAGIDVIPVCIKEKDPSKAVLVFKMLAPIFNAINLEDIKAPECFEIERRMIDETNIAVMHDDQRKQDNINCRWHCCGVCCSYSQRTQTYEEKC